MFNPHTAQVELVEAISKLDPYSLGLRGCHDSVEGRAGYIENLCKLVADHVERLAADVDATCPGSKIGEEDARAISDVGYDLSGRIQAAAERLPTVRVRSDFSEHNTLNRAMQGV